MSHGNQRSAGTQTLKHKFSRKIIFTQTDPHVHYNLVGDLNVTVNDDIDRWPSRHKENSRMIDFMNERDLIDIWRVSNTKEFTWQLRIDMWLISASLSYSDCKVEITLTPLTDPKAILLTLNM